jgi:alpha-glucoside transport system substrate-binding protein
MHAKKALWQMMGIMVILAMVLAACQPAATPAPATEAPAPVATEAPAEPQKPAEPMPAGEFPVMPGGELEKALAGEYSGTTVTVDGPFTDADKVKFEQSYKPFEEATGIKINYIGSKEFEGSISIRVDAGDAPDIADFPQPGLLASFVSQGKVVDPTTFIPQEWLEKQYNESWLDMAMMPGPDGEEQTAGVWYRFNGKSLVWYPKDDFEAAGYTIPETWDELIALSDQIVADGDARGAWASRVERRRVGQRRTGWKRSCCARPHWRTTTSGLRVS